MFLFENIFPGSNILGVPNYMTRMLVIYLNFIYNALLYPMTEYFSCTVVTKLKRNNWRLRFIFEIEMLL